MRQCEIDAIKIAKQSYKNARKNKVMYEMARNEMIEHIVKAPTPDWGSLTVIITAI